MTKDKFIEAFSSHDKIVEACLKAKAIPSVEAKKFYEAVSREIESLDERAIQKVLDGAVISGGSLKLNFPHPQGCMCVQCRLADIMLGPG